MTTWAEMSLLDRMVYAVEKVRDRLHRSTAALNAAAVPYAVIGGNAVAAWVATVDEAAVRNTRDVDILLRRDDLEAAEQALAPAGFTRWQTNGVDMFLDGENTGPKDAVRMIFANEKVRPHDLAETPDVTDFTQPASFKLLSLEMLVRMKLTSYRDKDRTHLRDMLDVGLIDASWLPRLPAELADRLQAILNDPNG